MEAQPQAILKEGHIPFSRFNLQSGLLTLFLAFIAFLVLTPLVLLIINSFQTGKPGAPVMYSLQGWRQALTTPGIVSAIYSSFSLAITRQLLATVIGIFLAWLLARTDLPLRGFIEFMFWLAYFLPTLPVALGWILLLDPKFGIVNQILPPALSWSAPR